MRACCLGFSLLGLAASLSAPAAEAAREIVFENAAVRVALGEDAVWRSLVEKRSDTECHVAGRQIAFAAAEVDGKRREARRASLEGNRLRVELADCDTRLIYRVDTTEDWIAWRLVGVEGTRPGRLTLVRLRVGITRHAGSRLGAAWNDQCAICLRGLNLQTEGRLSRGDGYTQLEAVTQDEPGPKLEGAAAALVAAPTAQLPDVLHRLSVAYDLPRNEDRGVPSKQLPVARRSYWFLRFGEEDVERVIDCCRRTGLRQVMMNSHSWCKSPGHYTFHENRYPDGLESLRRTVARLHEQGILVGMHCFASKVSKTDAYVTPTPDRRFWVDRRATLAADLGADDAVIRTGDDLSQWPGSPIPTRKTWEGGVEKHQEVVLDDEIIAYRRIGPEGKWDSFLGCRRGAWGTRAALHRAGTPCRHYGVDGCINGYIIDQETTLLDEVTTRLAHIFNTCGFDMVYFDGGEDVDRRRFNYYVSKFQATAMGKFRKRPLVHMGTIMTHQLWHSFTRSATVDTYLNTIRGRRIAGGTWDTLPTVKEHIDRSVGYMQRVGEDMMPGELGWFGIWPEWPEGDGLQPDQIEYLMAKSLAYEAPISLQTSFSQMQRHGLTPAILEIVRRYEHARGAGTLPEQVRRRLKQPGKDFVMLPPGISGGGRGPRFVEVERVAEVAGGHDVRAFLGPLEGHTIVAVWHRLGREARLLLPAERIDAYDVSGDKVELETSQGKTVVPLGGRRSTLLFSDREPEEIRRLLAEAQLVY